MAEIPLMPHLAPAERPRQVIASRTPVRPRITQSGAMPLDPRAVPMVVLDAYGCLVGIQAPAGATVLASKPHVVSRDPAVVQAMSPATGTGFAEVMREPGAK